MIGSIRRLWERLHGPRQRRNIELDAVQQLALAFIAQFEGVSEQDVFAEVTVRRPYIDWPETFMALMKLRSSGLIMPEPGHGTGGRRYSATKLGRKLARLIPRSRAVVLSSTSERGQVLPTCRGDKHNIRPASRLAAAGDQGHRAGHRRGR